MPDDPISLLLLLATPAEEKGLKQAAQALSIPFHKVKTEESPLRVEHYNLGAIGNQTGVIALPPAKDAENKLVMGSLGFFGTAARAMRLRAVTGARGIVQVGMAFGIDPKKQKAGDVLVSTSIIPYDNRDIKPAQRCWLTRLLCGRGFVTEYQDTSPEPARPSLVELFRREQGRVGHAFQVYLGAILSGAARIHSGFYRDELARSVPSNGEEQIVGGEMEGVGLLAASISPGDPIWCVVKGISDFADENRDAVIKENRPVACLNAAKFVLSALANDALG